MIDDFGTYYDEEVRYYKDFKVEEDCKNFELDLQESTYDKIVIRRIKWVKIIIYIIKLKS